MTALIVILVPLVAAFLVVTAVSEGRRKLAMCPLAAVPAFLLALFGDADRTDVFGWLMLESHLGMAHSGPVFLFFTATLWLIAGGYAVGYVKERSAGPFACYWLLTMTGNFGLVLAGDVPSFYAFFALMTFSAYGLVVYSRSDDGWRAGKVYIIMAVVGEAMLIGAFLLAVAGAETYLLADASRAVAESSQRNLIVFLALAGFGVKAGIFPLHLWLPLAHPVAPAPASAVLSGVMIKAGLLGWIQLFPGGEVALPGWSLGMVGLGMFTAFYAVVCGLVQREMKTVLAYSSISQMGLMLVVAGAGLAEPAAWEAAVVVLGVYALNHAFAKGSLFLGAAVCEVGGGLRPETRRWILAGLLVPALAIAGAPLMGGAIAKDAMKLATEIPGPVAPWLKVLLPMSAVATTLLLGRFWLLARARMAGGGETGRLRGRGLAWGASLLAAKGGVYFAIPWYALELETGEPSLAGIWGSLWPILVGVGMLWGVHRIGGIARPVNIPPGDIVTGLERTSRWSRRRGSALVGAEKLRIDFHPLLERIAGSLWVHGMFRRGEFALRRRETVGCLMMFFLLVLWLLLGG